MEESSIPQRASFGSPPPKQILLYPPLRAYDDNWGYKGDSRDRNRHWPWSSGPQTLREFLKCVNNPDEVEIWFRVYKFNTILHYDSWNSNAYELWTYHREERTREETLQSPMVTGNGFKYEEKDFRVLEVDQEEFLAVLNDALLPIGMPRDLQKIIWEYYFDVLDSKLIAGKPPSLTLPAPADKKIDKTDFLGNFLGNFLTAFLGTFVALILLQLFASKSIY